MSVLGCLGIEVGSRIREETSLGSHWAYVEVDMMTHWTIRAIVGLSNSAFPSGEDAMDRESCNSFKAVPPYKPTIE